MTLRPNFLIIVADDLGFSDVGCFGGEIDTPHIDRIGKEGAIFTQCKLLLMVIAPSLRDVHAAAACSPTRAMLMSGTDNHLAGVGIMSEQRATDYHRWNVRGHEGYLNHDVATLPELLRDSGYHTMMVGKWHLGLTPDTEPSKRGFNRAFALLPGCSNHFGYEPQFEKTLGFFERIPPLYVEQGKRVAVEPNRGNGYDGFYSSNNYVTKMIDYLEEWRTESSDKPFFAFLPFSAPHWPLQCSPSDRNKYAGIYNDGPAALRLRRLQQLAQLGILRDSVVPHEVVPLGKEWEEMSAEERALSARSMEVYAGMVDRMDKAIGLVLDHLEKIDEIDNTMIIFMSDNGADGAWFEAVPVMGQRLMDVIKSCYNNSLDNVGNHDSFVWYGPRWAQAATAPSRLFKQHPTEGGILVPFAVRYPPMFLPGEIVPAFATVMDICPTVLELAGISHPVPPGQRVGRYRDHEVFGMRGRSWVPFFKAQTSTTAIDLIWDSSETTGWELFGRAALRKGAWKMVNMPTSALTGKGRWELFNIYADPGETTDLAESEPAKLNELLADWDIYVTETNTVWGPPLDLRGNGSANLPSDSIGGDPIAQTKAWMV